MIKQAIVLVAGRGRRLSHLTELCPKPLLKIDGKSIIENSLNLLSSKGISKVVLVVGYRAEKIRKVIGRQFQGMEIKYVENNLYSKTNTAYSIWLARAYLSTPTILLEGDIIFDEDALNRLINYFGEHSVWAGVPITPQRNEGILLACNNAGFISGLKLVTNDGGINSDLNYKCAGIQLLTRKAAKLLLSNLKDTIDQGQLQKYADLVLGELLPEISIKLCSLDGLRWAEVDDEGDYQVAKELFGK